VCRITHINIREANELK